MNHVVGIFGTILALLNIAQFPSYAAPIDSDAVNRESKATRAPKKGTKSAPTVVVTMTPSKVKIDDTTKRGAPLATITARWTNGAPYTGKLTLTKNPGGICRLVGTEVQLGRDATKADDYTTSVCTVTAVEKEE